MALSATVRYAAPLVVNRRARIRTKGQDLGLASAARSSGKVRGREGDPKSGSHKTRRWRKTDSNPRSPKRRVLRARDALRSCQGWGTREDPWKGQPLAFLAALRIRPSAFIDTHLSHRRSRAFRPKAPVHAGRRRCRHSTTSVEAELWITDQYFGAAKKRDSAIDARG